MALVGIKLDSVTRLRQGKRSRDPDPAQLAPLAELGGADAVVAALHSSRSLIRDRDVYLLREIVKTRLILQIAPAEELMTLALEVRPWMVMLVGENRIDPGIIEPVSYGSALDALSAATERLKGAGIVSAHFVGPSADDVKNAARCKAEYVSLSTESYASAGSQLDAEAELDDLDRMAHMAQKLGMGVYCEGGLTYQNASQCAELKLVEQVTVGRAVVRRALQTGMERAVRDLRQELERKL